MKCYEICPFSKPSIYYAKKKYDGCYTKKGTPDGGRQKETCNKCRKETARILKPEIPNWDAMESMFTHSKRGMRRNMDYN